MKQKILAWYHRMSPAVRSSVWFTICNFLQRGTSLLFVPIFTRLLTTENYGICNIYFAWFDIFVLFTSLKLPYEGLNNGLIRHEEDQDGYTSSILGLIFTLTLGISGGYILLHSWIDRITGLNSFIMFFMFLQLLFNPPLMLWINRERFNFHYYKPVIVTLISTIVNPTVAVLAVLFTTHMAEARIISSALVQVFFGLLCSIHLFRRGKRFYKREYWAFALRFNLPLLAYYLSQSLLNQADRVMINYLEGSGKAAIYSVAYSAATLMLLLVSAINGTFNPWMYKKLKAGAYDDIAPISTRLFLLVAAGTLTITAFAPDLVTVLATDDYVQAIWVIPPISASVFFIFLYMMFANVEMYCGEVRGISVISILCSIVNIILNFIFIPLYGYLATGWTTLASYILLAILHYILMRRACRCHRMPFIFSQKLLLAVCIGVIALSFSGMAMYFLNWFRYVFLAAEALLLFCLRKKIFSALRQIRKGA